MFARVLPFLRTPIHVNGFDYRIPEQLVLHPGDVVRIPFRRQEVVGIVETILTESAFASRAASILGRYADLSFPPGLLRVCEETAARTFCSKPTVLHAWFRTLPKRPHAIPPVYPPHPIPGSIHAHWDANPEERLLQAATTATGRLLVIVPWIARVKRYHALLPTAATLTSELAMGEAFSAWSQWLAEPKGILLTTRVGAWLAPCASHVFLDEPENDDLKQDDQAPRYDARKIALTASIHAGTAIEAFGRTPPLHREEPAPDITCDLHVHVRHPAGKSVIPMVQADTLNALLAHPGPRVIIHPIRGVAARVVCRECGWRATCPSCGFGLAQDVDTLRCRRCSTVAPMPFSCPSCDGPDLGKALPGIEKLKLAWNKHLSDVPVQWRDLTNEAMDEPLPAHACVAVTDGSLLGGVAEDVKREERRVISFRRLAARVHAASGTLLLQTHEEDTLSWSHWLTEAGYAAFRQKERAERRMFHYPPSVRLVKALLPGGSAEATTWLQSAQSACRTAGIPPLELRGPFPAQFQSKGAAKRVVVHLVFAPETPESTLIQTLTPLAQHALLDLDPIAFLR